MNGEAEPERATGESREATLPPPEAPPPSRDPTLPPALSKPDRVQSRIRVGALYRWGFFAGLGLLSSLAAALVAIPIAAALKVVLVQQIDHYEAKAADDAPRPYLSRRRRRPEPEPPEPVERPTAASTAEPRAPQSAERT